MSNRARITRMLRVSAVAVSVATLALAGSRAAISSTGMGIPLHYQFAVGPDTPGTGNFSWIAGDVAPDQTLYVVDRRGVRVLRFGPDGSLRNAWGGKGDGPGRFNAPAGVAAGPDGTIYVADTGNARVQYFTPWGTYLGEWKGDNGGTHALVSPRGLTVGADGTIYVADKEADAVKRYSREGEFLGQFDVVAPQDVAVAADGRVYVAEPDQSRVGVYDGVGRFMAELPVGLCGEGVGRGGVRWYPCRPKSVTAAPDGIVYADAFAGVHAFGADGTELVGRVARIQYGEYSGGVAVSPDGTIFLGLFGLMALTPDGTRISAFEATAPDRPGLIVPTDVAAAADGSIYVADPTRNRVVVLTSDGDVVTEWGSRGWGDGYLDRPNSILVNADGTLLVADTGNRRVVRFSADGRFLGVLVQGDTIGSPLGLAALGKNTAITNYGKVVIVDEAGSVVSTTPDWPIRGSWLVDVAALDDGSVLIADNRAGRIWRWEIDGALTNWGDPSYIGKPTGIAAAGGNVFVSDHLVPGPDGSAPRAQVSRFLADGTYVGRLLVHDCADPEVGAPMGLTVAPDGRVLVSETVSRRVLRLGPDGTTGEGLAALPSRGDGRFPQPVAIGASSGGRVHVYDTDGRLQVLGRHGELLSVWRQSCPGRPNANDIAVAADGSVFLAENHRVVRMAADGETIATWGSAVIGLAKGIAIGKDASGREVVFVSDAADHSLKVFDIDGNLLAVASGPDRFSDPAGLGSTPDGHALVADRGNDRILVVTSDGETIAAFGESGDGPGQLHSPRDVAARADGLIVVADTGRLQAFAPDGTPLAAWSGSDHIQARVTEPYGVTFVDDVLWVVDRAERRIVAYSDSAPAFWHLRAYSDAGLIEGPVHVMASDTVDFNWGRGAPSPALPIDGFSLRIERQVPRPATYAVTAMVEGRGSLQLRDGHNLNLDSGVPVRLVEELGPGDLVRLDYMDPGGGDAIVRLSMTALTEARLVYLPQAQRR